MSENKPNQPSVPEEDLALHENFAPIIAENGLIRQRPAPDPDPTVFATQLDALQDLVVIRTQEQEREAEKKREDELQKQVFEQEQARRKAEQVSLSDGEMSLERERKTEREILPVIDVAEIATSPAAINPSGTADDLPAASEKPGEISLDLNTQDLSKIPHFDEQVTAPAPTQTTQPPATPDKDLPPAEPTVAPQQEVPTFTATATDLFTKTFKRKKKSRRRRRSKKEQTEIYSAPQKPVTAEVYPSPVSEPVATTPAHPVPPSQPPQEPVVPVHAHRWWRRWPLIVLAVAILVLILLGGVVPVERIPLLRNVAYAMGLSPDDTARMSFLRALLAWTDKTIGLPGEWDKTPTGTSLFAAGRLDGRGIGNGFRTNLRPGESADASADAETMEARKRRYSGKTNLINIAALQNLQRRRGRPVDNQIRGVVMAQPGQEPEQGTAPMRDPEVTAQTEANKQVGDVYFGADASTIERNLQDGYDSSKVLSLIKNPYITDGHPIDWLMSTASRMINADVSLGGLDKELKSKRIYWMSSVDEVGDTKPHKDLYHAWITSRMARHTQNEMLKKALADSSFLGAAIPTEVSNVMDFSGVKVDVGSFQEEQQDWKDYLEFERKCKAAFNDSGQKIQDEIDSFNKLVTVSDGKVDSKNWDFPKNCLEVHDPSKNLSVVEYADSSFSTSIKKIRASCKVMDREYKKLENSCYLKVARQATNCQGSIETDYEGHWNKFQQNCKDEFNTKFDAWLKGAGASLFEQYKKEYGEASAKEKLKPMYAADQNGWQRDGENYTEATYIAKEIPAFNEDRNYPTDRPVAMVDVVKDQQGGSGDYFPQEDKNTVNLMDTMQRYMQENEAFVRQQSEQKKTSQGK